MYGRYRKSSGSLRERKLHIAAAAAKALSRADGLAKRRKSSIDGGLADGPSILNEYGPAVSPGMSCFLMLSPLIQQSCLVQYYMLILRLV